MITVEQGVAYMELIEFKGQLVQQKRAARKGMPRALLKDNLLNTTLLHIQCLKHWTSGRVASADGSSTREVRLHGQSNLTPSGCGQLHT